ncbi:uncharacterized protein LOC133285268 [Gastrolobium bilobum]|uniref:uncharacterized protein LOC133285268 n=1 Tax=Gastrolobium bilobum TaxID=150636 RepID=UPI002AB01DAD|nr:uncharacterized protein LOC133285268 [Gastrolobium bilobum]
MGSNHRETQSSMLRKTLHLKAKKPETESLKVLGRMLKKPQQLTLARKYGNVLDLLEVDVQVEAITAIAQDYDSPLRCFTFQDFQLAPTLEEFEQIFGLSLEEEKPYCYIGHYPSMHVVAEILKVQVRDLQERKQIRNETVGFPRKYLEEHLHHLAEEGEWDTFIDVLALTIYGILIFPNIDEFVDFAAIDVFVARKFKRENPVPAILADVYYTLSFCHERKGKRILCCLPVLFIWLTAHMFNRGYKAACPIADFRMYQLKAKSGREWVETLAKLDGKSVRWYPEWAKIEALVYQCGDFPNVPLQGTRGCINYNPSLALRQLGYPMKEAPTEDMTISFLLYDLSPENTTMIKRVRNAWDKVVRKGKELGVRSCDCKENYRQWVKDRVKEVKLPFQTPVTLVVSKTPILEPIEDEEVKEVKARLMKVEIEKKKLEQELDETRQTCRALERKNIERDHSFERTNKKARTEEHLKLKTQDCLKAANKELGLRGQERDKALAENQQIKKSLRSSKAAEKDALRQAAHIQQHMEEVVAGYQDVIQRGQEDMQRLRDHIQEQEAVITEIREDVAFWMTRFSNLVKIANRAIIDVPDLLKMADMMVNPLSTPMEICDFIDHCKDLVREMKQLVSGGM